VTITASRGHPHDGPIRVLVGKERFSEHHAGSEMPIHWPARVAVRAGIEVVGHGQLETRLAKHSVVDEGRVAGLMAGRDDDRIGVGHRVV
jgi:hypothetical protein